MQRLSCIFLSLCLLILSGHPGLLASEEPADPPATEAEPPTPEPPPEEPAVDPREQALATLAEAAATGSLATQNLLELIADTTAPADLRNRAVLALAQIGLNTTEQAEKLFALLADPQVDFDLRWTILMAFSSHTQWQDQLLPVLQQIVAGNTQPLPLRQQGWQTLRQYPNNPATRTLALQLLASTHTPAELKTASLDLIKTNPQPPDSEVEEITRLATDNTTDHSLQLQLLQTLAGWQTAARPAIPTLVTEVANPDAPTDLRLEAMRTLTAIGDIGPVTAYLAPVLLQTNAPLALRQAIARLPELRNQPLPGSPSDWAQLTLDDSQPLAARKLALLELCSRPPSELHSTGTEISRTLLLQPPQDLSLRLIAADYLKQATPGDDRSWTLILERAEDPSEPQKLRSAALNTLAEQSRHWVAPPDSLTRPQLLSNLSNARILAERAEAITKSLPDTQPDLDAILQNLALLNAEWRSRPWDRLAYFTSTHPIWTLLLVLLLLTFAVVTAKKAKVYLQPVRVAPEPSAISPNDAPVVVPGYLQNLLNELLATDNPERSSVVDHLRQHANELNPAVPQLLEALQNEALDLDLRFAALTALGIPDALPDHATQAISQAAHNAEDPVFFRLKALEITARTSRQPSQLKSQLAQFFLNPTESTLIRNRAGDLLLTLGSLPRELKSQLNDAKDENLPPELHAVLKKLLP
ncbi:MAG: hypothetical protein RI897_2460 [Verrucomicrobiota bacterium]